MRPEEIAIVVLRRWWIIAIAALVAGLIGYAGTSSKPKTYTVNARIMAIADPPDYWMDLYAKNRLASYKDLINNYQFVHDALAAAGSDIDPGLAQSKLTLGHNPDANTIQIVATDTDPARAAEIVNALSDGFVARNEQDNERIRAEPRPTTALPAGVVSMLKLDTPTAPTAPSGPRVKVNTLAAAILGAVAGLVVVFGTIYFDDTLKKPADLDRYLELPLLASIEAPAISTDRGG
jgi:capsular polysaccharide biosynthesis protein